MLRDIRLYGLQIFIIAVSVCKCEDSDFTKFMKFLEVIPDVILEGPKDLLKISYDNHVQADKGVVLIPTQVKNQPNFEFSSDEDSFYTLLLTNPDAPSRSDPQYREFLHWLVVNIPGSNLNHGDVLTEYVGSDPPKGTGLHRYVFLLYKQPKKLKFDEPKISKTTGENRTKFSAKKFAEKYHLGVPIAGNVYQAQYNISSNGLGF